jgi:hypothetical protein
VFPVKMNRGRDSQYFGPLQTARLKGASVDSSSELALRCKPKTAYATVQPSGGHRLVPSSSLA